MMRRADLASYAAIAVVVAFAVLVFTYQCHQYRECDARGGVLVRGALGNECVEMRRR